MSDINRNINLIIIKKIINKEKKILKKLSEYCGLNCQIYYPNHRFKQIK